MTRIVTIWRPAIRFKNVKTAALKRSVLCDFSTLKRASCFSWAVVWSVTFAPLNSPAYGPWFDHTGGQPCKARRYSPHHRQHRTRGNGLAGRPGYTVSHGHRLSSSTVSRCLLMRGALVYTPCYVTVDLTATIFLKREGVTRCPR